MLSFWSWSKFWVCAFSFTKSKLYSGLDDEPSHKKEKSPPKSSSLCVSPVALLHHIKQMCGEGDVLLPGRTWPDWWRTRCAGGKERLPRAEVLDPEAAGTDLNQPPFIRSTVHCCNSWQENDSHIQPPPHNPAGSVSNWIRLKSPMHAESSRMCPECERTPTLWQKAGL